MDKQRLLELAGVTQLNESVLINQLSELLEDDQFPKQYRSVIQLAIDELGRNQTTITRLKRMLAGSRGVLSQHGLGDYSE